MSEKEDLDQTIDNITEQEQENAQNALSEVKKKNYPTALQHLNKLDSRSGDFKVVHNKAVVEFCKSDLKKTEAFQKHINTICAQFRIKIERLDDIEQCIVHYNQALLLYHHRQYTEAIRIMDRVYKFIEPMDEALAKQVSFFAIELQLCVRQPEKALSLITYLENHSLPAPLSGKPLDKTLKQKETKVLTSEQNSDEFKQKLHKYKARCFLMKHNLEQANVEIKMLAKNKPISQTAGLFFAANYEYLQGNLAESQKLLSSIPKDCLLFNECGESSNVYFYNNVGLLHHALGKPNLACHYFQMALKEDMALTNSSKSDRPLHVLGGSKYHELMHNLGISLLYAKRPAQAFECLIIAVRRYHRNARLWMRIGECCIMAHKASNESDFDIQKKQKEIIVDVVGSKDKQKVILSTNLSKDKKYNPESQSYAVPVPSLEFASLCLRNAYLLLPSADTLSSQVPLFVIPGVTPPAPSSTSNPSPSTPLTAESLANLKNSILAASAYVSLCLGDYVIALEHAENLLNQERISGAHKLLGHLYAAECLVLLDKIVDALEHLNPELIKEISLELPPDLEDNKNVLHKTSAPATWFPENLSTAHATIQYHIAVAKAIKGQLEDAFALLKQIWQMTGKCKIPGHIIMLVLYIELQMGHPEPARNLIKQYLFQNRT